MGSVDHRANEKNSERERGGGDSLSGDHSWELKQ